MSIHGDLKRQMRRDVHNTFGLEASYSDPTLLEPVDVIVRWHSRYETFGNLAEQGYAEVVDNVDRIVFDVDELVELDLTPRVGGQVTITETGWNNAVLVLQISDPRQGPVENVWQVGRGAS